METQPHCTVSPRGTQRDLPFLLALTLAVLLLHGFHPWAEDGGLYVAGVEYLLDPTLFPHSTAFVTEHLRFSLFAPTLAAVVRLTHTSLAAVLLATYLLSTALMLYAALRVARRCFPTAAPRYAAVGLLAAWWTLPVAGTSLLLMDPYVTARSLSTPLSLLALAFALDFEPARAHRGWQPALGCVGSLHLAAVFHPLMAAYGCALVVLLCLLQRRAGLRTWALVAALTILSAGMVQRSGPPEDAAVRAAVHSRYYWFLAQWHLYELLGLFAPLTLFAAFARHAPRSPEGRTLARLCHAAMLLGGLSLGVAILFAREDLTTHAVARLQPLRCFLLLYALLPLMLGGTVVHALQSRARTTRSRLLLHSLTTATVLLLAATMFWVQRQTFPNSPHIELPHQPNRNPWVQAFLWARENTPTDAVFALDARYVNTPGEDAQTFRAIAGRSAIPDFSKDGGEAAITPALASAWQPAADATQHLDQQTDTQRHTRLAPFGVTWLILRATTPTADTCPYRNASVKVCQFTSHP